MITPSIPRKFRFFTSTGVQSVRLSGDQIIGRFKHEPIQIGGKRQLRLIENFLNLPDRKGILGFTRKYGPLNEEAEPGAEFNFDLQDFRATQQQFREMWQKFRQYSDTPVNLLDKFGGRLLYQGRSISYFAPTLYVYLYIDLITSPVERVRVCKQEECGHPYFTAGHLNQQFCSDVCAQEGKRAWRREWWQKYGDSWRAKRRDEI